MYTGSNPVGANVEEMIEWYYLVIIAAILQAMVLIIEKMLLRSEHALSYSASVTLLIGLFSLLLIPFVNFSLNFFQLAFLFVYGTLLALSYWMTARLFRHGSLSTGSPAYNILPIIVVVVLAFIFLSENIGLEKYLAILVIICATFVMVGQSNRKRDLPQKKYYDYTIVVVALLIGIANAFLKYCLTQINVLTFLLFTSLFTPLVVYLLMVNRPSEYKKETKVDTRKFILPLVAIAVLSLGYRIFLYSAIAVAPVSIAIPLSSAIIVMITVLSGGLFFGEHRIAQKVTLSVIMLVAAYFLIAG